MKLKPYPIYNDSGVQWIGKIPDSWKITKIKFDTYVKGRVGWHGLNSEEFSDEGVHLVTGTDFEDGFVKWQSCYRITEERYAEDPYIQLQENDLLITKDGTIGKLARVKNLPVKASLNSGIFLIRAKNEAYLEDYLYWVLRSTVFNQFMDINKAGSTIQHLYQEVFNRFAFPIPSIQEQVDLVIFLDFETSKLDNLIAKQEHLIELLQEKRQALISHAVTKGLNPDAKMKDSGVEWLGMVPEHWKVRRLKFNLTLLNDKTDRSDFSIGLENIESWSGKYIKTETEFEGDGIAFNAGDILFGKLRPYLAKVYLAEFSGEAVGDFHVMRPRKDVNGKFAQYQMLNRDFISIVDGSTYGAKMPRASWDFVGGMMVTAPPVTEQNLISDYLDVQTVTIDTLIGKAQRSIELAKEHRTALISAAVTGKIDVRDYENDLEAA